MLGAGKLMFEDQAKGSATDRRDADRCCMAALDGLGTDDPKART